MKIGELAQASGTAIETIRFYEREGLMPAPERTESNYRIYGEAHVQRLVFIRRCRGLDMALDEVRALLAFIDAPSEDCSEVNRLLDEHIEHVRARMAELQILERELRELRARCQPDDLAPSCGILTALAQPVGEAELPAKPGARSGHSHVGEVHGRRAVRRA
ncbi:Cd(II)/Pb(II)-responsive transcriptional regulator [Paucibacter sp. KBW04]|uniref:Cd(II)/Pb(II)-responsive transcriptional regulator n=1 Tax=Paucibacter sp. KBW04 TaxID=2153361 RepID=UPI000F5668BF|nr:Cd(II)/Pb(II)-responsive transcriptional regulator [Paucibacter sp. KBW04]RQO63058.1 Cd(II)/Pb(II)-responsive transcriptional regulator [Paucibacter sp. KBW04]